MADKEEQRTGNKCYKPSSTTKTVNLGDGNRVISDNVLQIPLVETGYKPVRTYFSVRPTRLRTQMSRDVARSGVTPRRRVHARLSRLNSFQHLVSISTGRMYRIIFMILMHLLKLLTIRTTCFSVLTRNTALIFIIGVLAVTLDRGNYTQ
jgi:hypothetical protein